MYAFPPRSKGGGGIIKLVANFSKIQIGLSNHKRTYRTYLKYMSRLSPYLSPVRHCEMRESNNTHQDGSHHIVWSYMDANRADSSSPILLRMPIRVRLWGIFFIRQTMRFNFRSLDHQIRIIYDRFLFYQTREIPVPAILPQVSQDNTVYGNASAVCDLYQLCCCTGGNPRVHSHFRLLSVSFLLDSEKYDPNSDAMEEGNSLHEHRLVM